MRINVLNDSRFNAFHSTTTAIVLHCYSTRDDHVRSWEIWLNRIFTFKKNVKVMIMSLNGSRSFNEKV